MRYRYVVTGLLLAALTLSFTVSVPSDEWRRTVVAEDSIDRFVSMEHGEDGRLHVAYRDSVTDGVHYLTRFHTPIEILNDVYHVLVGPGWRTEIVDEDSDTGMFVDMAMINGKLHLAYQDGTVGDSRLVHAVKEDGSWQTTTVDDIGSSGVNVGVYASITRFQGEPVIFYHVAEGKQFRLAQRSGGEWSSQLLEKNVGWATDAESCGDTVFAAYRYRNRSDIRFGTFDGAWESRDLGVGTPSKLSIVLDGCTPHLAYYDDDRGDVMFGQVGQEFEPAAIREGSHSRVSAGLDSGFHVSYGHLVDGLVYARSEDGEKWVSTLLEAGERVGDFNAISARNGDITLAYTDGTDLVIRSKNPSSRRNARQVVNGFRAVMLVLIAFLAAPDAIKRVRTALQA